MARMLKLRAGAIRLTRLGFVCIQGAILSQSAVSSAPIFWTFTNLYSITGTNSFGPDALVLGTGGNLYGTTQNRQNSGNYGSVFSFNVNTLAFETIYSLTNTSGGYPTAAEPVGLLQTADGRLLCAAFTGGTFGDGNIFELTTNGAFSVFHTFDSTNGAHPESGLLLNPNDGNYYGTTFLGGSNGNNGTIFKLSPGGNFSTLLSFNGTNGSAPYGPLIVGRDGYLYGTTYFGGTNGNNGTVFRISTNGAFSNFFSFDLTNSGANPVGNLLFAADGRLYGTTLQGGSNNYGTVFGIGTNGTFKTLHAFNSTDGATAYTSLIQRQDGTLYGMTYFGGIYDYGTIYSLTTNGDFTSIYSFDGTNGEYPRDTLVQAADGTIYGATIQGGANDSGTIFKLSVSSQPPVQSPTLSLGMNGSSMRLTWNSVSNQVYQLQSTSELGTPQWTNNGPPFTATGTNSSITISPSQAKTFYRVMVSH